MGQEQSKPQPRAYEPRRRIPRTVQPALEDSVIVEKSGYMYTENASLGDRGPVTVSLPETTSYIQTVLQDPKNRLALSALSTANPADVLEKPSTVLKDTQIFNVKIPLEGSPVTNQRSSGRCWIFAATNVFRISIMKRYGLDKFELSQQYLFFWDKVEKANFFLESIIKTAEEDVSSRLVSTLMASPVGDGGQFDMIISLVLKYGLVPQVLYPDTYNAMNSSTMDRLLTTKLREAGLQLRSILAEATPSATKAKSVATAKTKAMEDVVRILTLTLGPPPQADKPFTWEYYTKDKVFKSLTTSPLDFAASLSDSQALRACGGTDVHRLFSLVHDPRNELNRHLTVDGLGNVWGGRPITYANVSMTTMKNACIAMLKKGYPVFFGSDVVGKYSDKKGIMDIDLVDYELGFNVKLGMSKADRLRTNESAMTHAMVLTAVHLDEAGKPVRWRVENSWSDTAGTDGYFVMSDKWMDEFCYQAVVDPGVVSKQTNDILKQEAKVLPLWDPLGALA